MPEPFKNMVNKKVIQGMAKHFQKHCPEFDSKGFIKATTKDLDSLELKARTSQVSECMALYLPADFEKAGAIILASLGTPLDEKLSKGNIDKNGIAGWAVIAKRIPDAELLAQDGVHIKYFDEPDEFFELSQWYLDHEKERKKSLMRE